MNRSRVSSQGSCALNQGLLPCKLSPPASPPLPSVSPEGKAKVDMLLLQVDALPILEDFGPIQRQLSALQEACVLACSDAETLKYAVERLHRACLKEESMCFKVAVLSNVVSSLEVEDVRFRTVLLNCLQEDYEARKIMQAESPQRFLNAATLLCEVFTRVRSQNTPITVLSKPVLDYLEALLNGDEQEIELFANLVALSGNDLNNVARSSFQKLLLKVRDTLKSRNLSSQCRLWLLLIMDISNRYFDSAPSDIEDFYKEHLGSNSSKLLNLVKSSCPTSQNQDAQKNTLLENNSFSERKEPSVTEKVSQLTVSNSSTVKAERRAVVSPRNDIDKRENFRAAVLDSKERKGNYWLHDDRFEKDELNKFSSNSSKPSASNWRNLGNGNKAGRDTSGHKNFKEHNSYNKTHSGEKEIWRNVATNQKNTPVQLDWQENWDD